jgi:hypothetical protein
MTVARVGWLGIAAAAAALAQPGLRPLPSAAEYRANAASDRLEIGARLLTPDQVRSTFATDVSRGYLVVEVALYPKDSIEVRLGDFSLRAGASQDPLRPIAPRIVAARIFRPPQKGRNVDIYPTVGVGYDRWGGRGGWSTGAGVGVGIGGGAPPPASDDDLRTMENELGDQALIEGPSSQPVAGYLFFAAPKRRNVTFDLQYDSLTLPLIAK